VDSPFDEAHGQPIIHQEAFDHLIQYLPDHLGVDLIARQRVAKLHL